MNFKLTQSGWKILKISKLKQIRKEKGLTQSELAEKCNISIKSVQAYEQGTRKLEKANKNTIIKICEVLNCKISDIIESEEMIKDE